MAILATSA